MHPPPARTREQRTCLRTSPKPRRCFFRFFFLLVIMAAALLHVKISSPCCPFDHAVLRVLLDHVLLCSVFSCLFGDYRDQANSVSSRSPCLSSTFSLQSSRAHYASGSSVCLSHCPVNHHPERLVLSASLPISDASFLGSGRICPVLAEETDASGS